jgi:transcriptional regulator with XRE-family HTH domain
MSNNIKQLRLARGLSLEQLAIMVGKDRGSLSRIENGHRRMTIDWLIALSKALEVDPKDIVTKGSEPSELPPGTRVTDFPRPRVSDARVASGTPEVFGNRLDQLPVRAVTAGQNSNIIVSDSVIQWVPRPRPLQGVPEAYAVYIINESMVPRYMPGWLAFIHPYRAVAVGDDAVVFLPDDTCLIKTVAKRTAATTTLTSFNPDYAPIVVNNSDILKLHKVLFGLPADAI